MTVAERPVDRRPNTSDLLPISDYERIIVSFSGGKDSLAALLHVLDHGVERSRVELWHQRIDGAPGDRPFMDWPVTDAYCRAVAKALDLRIKFQWREGGFHRELFKENARTSPVGFEREDGTVGHAGGVKGTISTRRRFPQVSADLRVRWCSPTLKIDVAALAINNDPALRAGNVLFVTGERREESANRARYAQVERHRTSNSRRRVDHWRPVIDWSESRVWEAIRRARVRAHPAYELGWGRVSCMTCIFGTADQWAAVKDLAPEALALVARYEKLFNTTIKRGQTVAEQAARGRSFIPAGADEARRSALATEYTAESVLIPVSEEWTLPPGAYRACGGPN